MFGTVTAGFSINVKERKKERKIEKRERVCSDVIIHVGLEKKQSFGNALNKAILELRKAQGRILQGASKTTSNYSVLKEEK